MIYLDAAATTLEKPPQVRQAMAQAAAELSTPGRGSHPAARRAEETAFRCRAEAAALFGVPSPENVALCTGALLLAFQNPIMHLFTSDETVVAFGCSAMHYFCPFYFLLAILHGMAGAVRGTGRSVPPMVVLLISLCLFRVVWIQFVLPFFAGIEGVFVLYPVSWALGAVLMALYAWKGSWMTYEHS